jgi:hypothetical protein
LNGEVAIVDCLAPQQSLGYQDPLLEAGCPLTQVGSHGPKLAHAAAEAGLDDERSRRHGGESPDLLGQQHRMPQGDEEQTADRAVRPIREKATEHRHVLHVRGRTGGVVVTERQRIEAGPIGSPRLAEHGLCGPARLPPGSSVEKTVPIDMPIRIILEVYLTN